MPVGTRLVFILGAIVVLQSPSARDRLVNMLNSTGLKISTTQEGLATAEKSVLVALEIQLSTLHEPVSEISAASTAYALLAPRASSVVSDTKIAGVAANTIFSPVNRIRKTYLSLRSLCKMRSPVGVMTHQITII